MERKIYEYGILGGGPAGYTLALKLAMSGACVVLFEKENLGGTCLNKGCIPTKSILYNTNLIYKTRTLTKFGINIDASGLDFSKIIENKNNTVEKLNKSLGLLLKSYDIEIIKEEVISFEQGRINTTDAQYECKKIILATGTIPAKIPGLETNNKTIFNSDGILNLVRLPESVAIIGSGAIGIEWSRIFSDLGLEVTLIEAQKNILPLADIDVSLRVERLLKKKRVKVEKNVTVTKIDGSKLLLSDGKEITSNIVLVAIGRSPIMPEHNLEFNYDGKFLAVDEKFMTNVDDIYAIGDLNGLSLLAHSAAHQAVELADYFLKGKMPEFFKKDIPSVVYGTPEVAWFGVTEQTLEKNNADYKKVLFPISAIGKSHTDDEIDGFVKILVQNEKILGVSIIAPEAASMLMQFMIAKANNLPYKAILNTIFPHPTFSEAVNEAVLAIDNQSLCLPKGKN